MTVAWMGGLGSGMMMAGASVVTTAPLRAPAANESTKKFAAAGMRSRHAHNESQGMDRHHRRTYRWA